MEFAFYICGLIAILATLRVITHTNPVHALLYLIISLQAVSAILQGLPPPLPLCGSRSAWKTMRTFPMFWTTTSAC